MEKKNYKILLLSLTISFIIMYTVMFLNVARLEHVYLSFTRFYMVLLMVAPMALTMVLLMRGMFKDRKLNMIIIVAAIAIFILALAFLRTQTPISDEQYMKAMIPHHSSAILTSEEANLKDPEVIALAEQIIETQKREIAQMKDILQRM